MRTETADAVKRGITCFELAVCDPEASLKRGDVMAVLHSKLLIIQLDIMSTDGGSIGKELERG